MSSVTERALKRIADTLDQTLLKQTADTQSLVAEHAQACLKLKRLVLAARAAANVMNEVGVQSAYKQALRDRVEEAEEYLMEARR